VARELRHLDISSVDEVRVCPAGAVDTVRARSGTFKGLVDGETDA
jgi:hypothetical protein